MTAISFKHRLGILSALYGKRFKVYLEDDSTYRTGELERIQELIDVFNEDTKETLNEEPKICPHDDLGDLFTVEEWSGPGMKGCGFIPSDGSGYWATSEGFSWNHDDVFGHQPSWATHVVWCNA